NNPDPLAMYIFSKNKNFTKYLISAIPAGGVTINDVVVHFVNVKLPFGGTAASGFGKSHGFSGFKSFSNEKPIMKQPAITPLKFLYPPYTKFVKKLIELTVKYF
ncbi:MAG: aldehyde dehydrogenase family protein, partial [Melioribacteraceae bacterium]